jgi:hypothetical protein
MQFDLTRFTAIFKILVVIPVLVGVLSLVDLVLPTKKVPATVTDKVSSYRLKSDNTTYSLHFGSLSEQFDEQTFRELNIGDSVTLEVTLFNRTIESLTSQGNNYTVDNNEYWATILFGLIYLLSGLIWFKTGFLSQKQSILILFIIVAGFTQAIKIFFL